MTLRAEGLLIAPFLCHSEGANPLSQRCREVLLCEVTFWGFPLPKNLQFGFPRPDAVWEAIQAKAINVVDNTT